MDDPGIPVREHQRALFGLARINRLSGAASSIWRAMTGLLASETRASPAAVEILDLATGSGDVAIGVGERAIASGLAARLHLVDVSDVALAAASARACRAGIPATSYQADVLAAALPIADRAVHTAMCSLFLHHLDEADVVRVLVELRRVVSRGVVVSDLQRCRCGLIAAMIAGRVLTTSRIVRTDSVLSVRAAWTPDELRSMAERAGMTGAVVRSAFPFRMLLVWRRP